jgi:type IV pilus assembly protein PilC
MHILLESGLPLVSTLDISARTVGNAVVEKNITIIKDKVRSGSSLAKEFEKGGLFPPLVSEMAKIGEETGTMPQIFQKISSHYQKELTTLVERIIVAFEPAMILLIGIMIGVMVIALFMPLFQLSTMGSGR